ncbi:MAG: hypothetical protein Q9220_005977 [cf. Caloplaca sp. 1 TL-2023]
MSSGLEVAPSSERRDYPSLKDVPLTRQSPKPLPAPQPTSNGTPSVISLSANEARRRDTSGPDPQRLKMLEATVDGQQKDINRLLESFGSLHQELKTMKASIDFLKFQQKTLAGHETSNSPTELVENIDVLAKKVARIESKVDENEEFTQELRAMRSRLEHLESVIQSPKYLTTEPRLDPAGNGIAQSSSEHVLGLGDTQEVPSSTVNGSHSEPLRGRSVPEFGDSTAGIEGRYSPNSRSLSEQLFAPSRASIEPVTSDEGTFDRTRPQITSAEKIARAQKRHHFSSSASSSDISGPPSRPQSKQPRIRRKPDWTTKPTGPRLNDYEHVLTSDPEDSDYDPDSLVQSLENAQASEAMRAKGGFSKFRGKAPVRLPTPEWEKPDWDGPPPITNQSTRGRHTVRRGVSGRETFPGRDSLRLQSSEYSNGDYTNVGSPQFWDNAFSGIEYRKPVTVGPISKMRDERGRLLNPDGSIDGRSLRHVRERKRRQEVTAQQEQQEQHPTGVQQKSLQAIPPAQVDAAPRFVDAAALAAAGYVPAVAKTIKTEVHSGPQYETLNSPAAGPPPNQSSSSLTAAPVPQSALNGTHTGLMKQVFPWR